MALRLSIIVPMTHASEPLEDTLVSVLEHRPEGCEVLVPHASCYDDPYCLEGEVRLLRQPAGASLFDCLRAGCEAARGEIVHLLLCGMTAERGWADAALRRFAAPQVAAVAPLVLSTLGETTLAAGVACSRGGQRRVLRRAPRAGDRAILAPTLEAGFYRREALADLGGFDAGFGEQFADVDLGLTLAEAGVTAVCEPACRVFRHAQRPRESAFREGLYAERLFWRRIRPRGGLLAHAAHLAVAAGDVLRRLPRPAALAHLAGRAIGMFERPTPAPPCDAGGHVPAPETPAATLPETIRIDGAHAAGERPPRGAAGETSNAHVPRRVRARAS